MAVFGTMVTWRGSGFYQSCYEQLTSDISFPMAIVYICASCVPYNGGPVVLVIV